MRLIMSSAFLIALLISAPAGAEDADSDACNALAAAPNLYQACLKDLREKAEQQVEESSCGCSPGAMQRHKEIRELQELKKMEEEKKGGD